MLNPSTTITATIAFSSRPRDSSKFPMRPSRSFFCESSVERRASISALRSPRTCVCVAMASSLDRCWLSSSERDARLAMSSFMREEIC